MGESVEGLENQNESFNWDEYSAIDDERFKLHGALFHGSFPVLKDGRDTKNMSREEISAAYAEADEKRSSYVNSEKCPDIESLGLSESEKRSIPAFYELVYGARKYLPFANLGRGGHVLDSKNFVDDLRKWVKSWDISDDEYLVYTLGNSYQMATSDEDLEKGRELISVKDKNVDKGLMAVKL